MHVVEREIARIAGRQDCVITRDQLLEAGLGRGAIAHRVSAGRMRRLHSNVTDQEVHVAVIGRNPGHHPGTNVHRHWSARSPARDARGNWIAPADPHRPQATPRAARPILTV